MTRNSDVFIPLEERVAIENAQKNCIFVSIHFNDSAGARFTVSKHITTLRAQLISRRPDPGQADNDSSSLPIAACTTQIFGCLRLAKYPAVLVECGFLSNRREGGAARDSEYRDQLADKIAEAIVEQRYGAGVHRRSAQAASTPVQSTALARLSCDQ